jgi:ParB/RepB/Spo0J family partition protein
MSATLDLISIDVFLILFSPTNPRKRVDEKHLQELADSIKEKGLIQPVTVVADEEGYTLVCGERRLRAARLAGLQNVPAIVRDLTPDQVLEIQVIENAQREDVTPLEESDGFKAIIERGILDARGLAEKIGKSPEYIAGRLQLQQLIPTLREWLDEGWLKYGAAVLVARLEPEMQTLTTERHQLFTDWQGDRMSLCPSIAAVRAWIERMATQPLANARFDIEDAKLIKVAGACCTCPFNTKAQLIDLEPDEPATCLKPSCFQRKQHLTDEAAIKVAQTAYPKAKLVADHWESKGGVLGRGALEDAKPEAFQGSTPIVVKEPIRSGFGDTEKHFMPGQILHVKKSLASGDNRQRGKEAEDREEAQKRLEREFKIRTADNEALFALVKEKARELVLSNSGEALLRQVVRRLVWMSATWAKPIFKATGLSANPTAEELDAWYQSLTAGQLLEIVVANAWRDGVKVHSYGSKIGERMRSEAEVQDLATALGIDVYDFLSTQFAIRIAKTDAEATRATKKAKKVAA